MKKPWILVTVIVAFIYIVSFVGYRVIMENNKEKIKENELKEYEATLELVKDINQNSDFGGLELLKFSDKAGENQHSQGASDIQPDGEAVAGGGVKGYYFHYPKDSNDKRLTQINITKVPYHVYSIMIGQHISDVAPVLKEKGFNEFDKEVLYEDTDMITFRQHHVSIFLDVNKDTEDIRNITVSVYDK